MKRLFNVLAVLSLVVGGSAFAAEHMHAAAAAKGASAK